MALASDEEVRARLALLTDESRMELAAMVLKDIEEEEARYQQEQQQLKIITIPDDDEDQKGDPDKADAEDGTTEAGATPAADENADQVRPVVPVPQASR